MTEQMELRKFAVLIDGDNAQASLLHQTLAEVSKFGLITIKRIYGDWTSTTMNSWKPVLHKYAIQPIQQFRNTVGKNATDSAMIIDAMDLLHGNTVDAFCIVSSDSDYTRLATRIREGGFFVIGVGEKKTPEAFTNACNQFIFCENLVQPRATGKKPTQGGDRAVGPDPRPLLLQAFELAAKDEEWAYLSTMGSILRRLDPAFDPRTFGHTQLQSLIRKYPAVFVLKRDDSRTPPVVLVGLTDQQTDAAIGRR